MTLPRIDRPADEHGGFDARFVPFLRAAEGRHFWFRARNRLIAAFAARITAPLPPGYRLIEVGCGTGNTLRALTQACTRGLIFGADFLHAALLVAHDRVSCPLVQADVTHDPFLPTVRFDAIGMFDVLEHIEDDRRVLVALRGLLKPGGALLVTVPCDPRLWSRFDVAAHHCRRYRRAELEEKLEAAGFTVEFVSPFMAAIYPVVWLTRRLASARSGTDDFDVAVADLRIVPVVNGLLERLLGLEARLVAGGWRLPFGTSLVALARRPVPTSG